MPPADPPHDQGRESDAELSTLGLDALEDLAHEAQTYGRAGMWPAHVLRLLAEVRAARGEVSHPMGLWWSPKLDTKLFQILADFADEARDIEHREGSYAIHDTTSTTAKLKAVVAEAVNRALASRARPADDPTSRALLQRLVAGWEKVEPYVNSAFVIQHVHGGGGFSGPKDFADALKDARAHLADDARPPEPSQCFECGSDLHAPFCPACNPEMAQPVTEQVEGHLSDCARHNGPALLPNHCDCKTGRDALRRLAAQDDDATDALCGLYERIMRLERALARPVADGAEGEAVSYFDYSKTRVITRRGPIEHELKTWSVPYAAVESGAKPFEFRKNDRDYREGDALWLRETNVGGTEYTGRELRRTITYCLLGGQFGVPLGYAVLGLSSALAASQDQREGEG